MPIAAACDRGFMTHGGGTRAVHSLTVSWLSTCTKSGQLMPAERARLRIASLSRNACAVVWPIPGTWRCSRSIAASLDVEVVERDDPIDALGLGEVGGALADVRLGHVAADVEELVDRLPRPVAVAQLLLGQEQDAAPCRSHSRRKSSPLLVGGDAEEG